MPNSDPQPGPGEGFALMPLEPTVAMVKAGRQAISHLPMERNALQVALLAWRAMAQEAARAAGS